MVKYNMEISGYTIIEVTADFMYFVLTGSKDDIYNFVTILNNNNKDNNIKYISSRIDMPSSFKLEQLKKIYKKKVSIDNGIESSQCFAFAEGLNKKTYMLMILEEINNELILGYPKLNLSDEEDPEETIITWLKKKSGKVPKGIRKTIKPITLVGTDDNILLYVAKMYDQKNISKTKSINNIKKQS